MAESPKVLGDNTVRITVLSDGSKIDETYRIISVTIHKKINTVPYAKLVLKDGDIASGDFPISNTDDFKPGKEIKIKASRAIFFIMGVFR